MMTSLVDKLFLLFAFLVALLPRPTAEGPERWVVPVLLAGLVAAWFLLRPREQRPRGGNLQILAFVLGFPIAAYFLRTLIHEGMPDEAMQVVSRFVFAIGLFVLTSWLCSTQVPRKTIFKYYFWGFLATSVLTIFCGITGVQILEEESIKPSRFLGFQKSTGIFRSFGEFGILAGIAWSYLLIYRRDFHFPVWITAAGMILLSALISQSRNVYLVMFVATILVPLFGTFRAPAIFRVMVAGLIVLIPVAVELTMPFMRETSLGNTLIGTGSILERNVEVRFDQYGYAQKLIRRDPAVSLIGNSRDDWREVMAVERGTEVAPHNHFLSNLLFLGLIGGAVWIIGLYIVPAVTLAASGRPMTGDRLLTLNSLLLAITGLSFYEGFFSVVVMLTVGMAWSGAWAGDPVRARESTVPVRAERVASSRSRTSARELRPVARPAGGSAP